MYYYVNQPLKELIREKGEKSRTREKRPKKIIKKKREEKETAEKRRQKNDGKSGDRGI